MKNYLHKAAIALATAALCLPVVAQTNTTTTNPPTINQRKDNQQDRIANGVASGSLNAGETRSLERQETDLNKEEHQMRAMDNGHLTQADKAALHQQQNQLSHEIYQDKHNAAVQKHSGEVGARETRQQDRIAQGVNSGQLTANEAAHLENQEAHLNKEIHNDRAANGGKLTAAEKKQINRQENHISKNIYNDKHNGRKR